MPRGGVEGVRVYTKRGAESRRACCHVETLLMKRRQMSAVSSPSAPRVGLKGGIVNTGGVHAIVTTFFPSTEPQPTPRCGAPARPGMASSPRLNTRISGLLIEQPRSRKIQMGADKWSFQRPYGFWGDSSVGGGRGGVAFISEIKFDSSKYLCFGSF